MNLDADFVHPDSRPFYLPGGSTGCLLLHGFTGTPQEMRFLGERLHADGYTVSGVQLAGHGTSPADLERRSWLDWYASARTGLVELQQTASRVIVIGLSMGALLALKLGAAYPAAVDGVVLLSPALVLANRWLYRIVPLLPVLLPLMQPRWRYVRKAERDIADAHARTESLSYTQIPLRALRELVLLQAHARTLLPRVQQPALIMHGRNDHTCLLSGVALLREHLPHLSRCVLPDGSYHVITVDVDKEQVASEVATFVAATTGRHGHPEV
jgi:carboxylesterase